MSIIPKVYAGTSSFGGIVVGTPGGGADGDDGAQGPPGLTGSTGATGSTGPAGADGAMGAPGISGGDGDDGMMGPPGSAGAAGATGSAGADGAAGARGSDGQDGDDGIPGIPGTLVGDFKASGAASDRGMVPNPGAAAGTTRYLREDATWAAPTAVAADPAYAPGSFTLATGTFRIQAKRLTLTGAQRATLQGTARVVGIR